MSGNGPVDPKPASAGQEERARKPADEISPAVVAEIDREAQVALARRDVARRSDYLRGVLYGGLSHERCLRDAPLFGLSPYQSYYALRSRTGDGHREAELTQAIMRSGSTSAHRPVLAVVDGDLVGLAPAKPKLQDAWLVAVAHADRLTDAAEAFARAGDALLAGLAFGITGVFELADLGPLPLVLGAQSGATELEQRHFSALDAQGRVGAEIEFTVRTMMELDQDVGATGAALHIHRNAVRYRLKRFRELTGLDVHRTSDFVTTWWLLHRRDAQRRMI